jgi:hypothetical protein
MERGAFRSNAEDHIDVLPSDVGFMGGVICEFCAAKRFPAEAPGLCCGRGRDQSCFVFLKSGPSSGFGCWFTDVFLFSQFRNFIALAVKCRNTAFNRTCN